MSVQEEVLKKYFKHILKEAFFYGAMSYKIQQDNLIGEGSIEKLTALESEIKCFFEKITG